MSEIEKITFNVIKKTTAKAVDEHNKDLYLRLELPLILG